ncbi:MAG: hypothetical protein HY435_00520 [Candidatus Liptonbacteria bacterium]|nr:hypothetical protein [Candidatus Liptonbacteria bacterium]
MKFEKPEERLSEDEAHDEANMLRAKLEVSPETGDIGVDMRGRFRESGERPTAEDYDNALAAIEELRKIASEEPGAERIINKLKDLPLKAAAGIELAFRALGIGIETFSMAGALDPGNKEGETLGGTLKRRWKRERITHENESLGLFHDAENNLRALKTRAESFGKEELE